MRLADTAATRVAQGLSSDMSADGTGCCEETLQSLDDMFDDVFAWSERVLRGVRQLDGLYGWRDPLVPALGSFKTDHRVVSSDAIARWTTHVGDTLERLRAGEAIAPEANVPELTTSVVAALQGGILLARISRAPQVLAIGLTMALDHLPRRC